MLSQPVRASVCALYCALSACSENTQKGPQPSAAAPKYSLDRPVEGLSPPLARDPNFRRGVSVDLSLAEPDEPQRVSYGAFVEQVARLGATDLELLVQWSQLDAASLEIAPSATMTVDDEFLGWLMDQANLHQLRVLITPVIELEQPVAEGQPGSRALAPGDSARWFWNYHRFLLHYARIAEAHHAACFAVGADLPDALVKDPAWPALIKDVRKAYKGKLTYAARWDAFEDVPFWDNLEEVTLAGVGEAWSRLSKAERDKRLSGLTQRMDRWSKERGRPLLLSGVHSAWPLLVPGAKRPDARGSMEQLDALRGLYQSTLQRDRSVAGVYVAVARPAPVERSSAPPLGSAAAAVLGHWYTRSRATSAAAATLH